MDNQQAFYFFFAETDKLTFFGLTSIEDIMIGYITIFEEMYGLKPLSKGGTLTQYLNPLVGTKEAIKNYFDYCSTAFTDDAKSKLPIINQRMEAVFKKEAPYYVYVDGKREDIEEHLERLKKMYPTVKVTSNII